MRSKIQTLNVLYGKAGRQATVAAAGAMDGYRLMAKHRQSTGWHSPSSMATWLQKLKLIICVRIACVLIHSILNESPGWKTVDVEMARSPNGRLLLAGDGFVFTFQPS